MAAHAEPVEPPLQFSSSGKLLLFGEHAAVYGYPAVGVSLDCSLTLEISPSDDRGGTAAFPGLTAPERDLALAVMAKAAELLPELSIPSGVYRFFGDVPRSSGFGSSAALCVNLARYLVHLAEAQSADLQHLLPKFQHASQWPRQEQRQYLLWFIANELEKVFHGSPSGIDTGLAALGGIQAFFPRSRKLPDSMALSSAGDGIYLVYAAVPRQGNTMGLVGDLQKAMLEETPRVVQAMEALGELAHQAIECFQNCAADTQTASLGALAVKARDRLETLNLNTDDMDRILDRGQRLGSPGGKLSGAGGGGAFYLYAASREAAGELQEQLTVFCRQKALELSQPLRILKI